MDKKLIAAVKKQLGSGWKDDLKNVSEHGADGGYNGFIYTEDTVKFFKENRDSIIKLAEEQAEDLGVGMLQMISEFGVLNGDYSIDEIGKAIFDKKYDKNLDSIYNVLAWYALEEVARYLVDLEEN